jgi:hypothetical protein
VEVPKILRGSWFAWIGRPETLIIDAKQISNHGEIMKLARNGSDFTMIFKDRNCYYCIKAFTRYAFRLACYELAFHVSIFVGPTIFLRSWKVRVLMSDWRTQLSITFVVVFEMINN